MASHYFGYYISYHVVFCFFFYSSPSHARTRAIHPPNPPPSQGYHGGRHQAGPQEAAAGSRHPEMGGAPTGGRRVFSSFKSAAAGPSDKPLCVIDLGSLLLETPSRLERSKHTSATAPLSLTLSLSLSVGTTCAADSLQPQIYTGAHRPARCHSQVVQSFCLNFFF